MANNSGLPDWARITADIVDDDEQVTPPQPRSQAPTSPYGEPVAPEPAAPPRVQPQYTQPQPEHTQRPPQPQPQYTQPQPEYTQRPPQPQPQYTQPQPEYTYTHDDPRTAPLPPLPQSPQRAQKGLGKGRKKVDLDPEETSAIGRRWRGRTQVYVLRAAVWGVLGLLILGGLKGIVSRGPNTGTIAAEVAAQLGFNGFPITAGQGTATRYAFQYFNVDPADPIGRNDRLAALTISGDSLGAPSSMGPKQLVVQGPVLAQSPDLADATHARFTLVTLVQQYTQKKEGVWEPNGSPIWYYLVVPVVADEDRHTVVAGAPAVVPSPSPVKDVQSITLSVDEQASTSALNAIQQYFTAWAASDKNALQPYITVNSTRAATIGLQGSLAPQSVSNLQVALPLDGAAASGTCKGPDFGAPCRTAYADVKWGTADGMVMSQTYRLTLEFDGQYWHVVDLMGGGFGGR